MIAALLWLAGCACLSIAVASIAYDAPRPPALRPEAPGHRYCATSAQLHRHADALLAEAQHEVSR